MKALKLCQLIILLFSCGILLAQDPLNEENLNPVDSSLNMDAVYNRPFLGIKNSPVSIGGYVEVNWQHLGTDGVSEGHQFQARRLTLFASSVIADKLKFLTEIEFEEGGRTIAIEFASLDVTLHPLLNLRGGIILNPIGAFNQNHDGPKWEFTDRPVVSTELLPATFSNAGFGIFGKYYKGQWMFGYEAYLSGGFDPTVVDNVNNRTFLPASKNNPERFEEGNSLITAKISGRHENIGEVGLSIMNGRYNHPVIDGIEIDRTKRVNVLAFDFNTEIKSTGTRLVMELATIKVDVDPSYSQQYGESQAGGFLDIIQPIVKKNMFGWKNATLLAALRLEAVDWNVGSFRENGDSLGDEMWSIMPAISFRLVATTVFRLNYLYRWQQDLLKNPASRTAGFSFGISTYF